MPRRDQGQHDIFLTDSHLETRGIGTSVHSVNCMHAYTAHDIGLQKGTETKKILELNKIRIYKNQNITKNIKMYKFLDCSTHSLLEHGILVLV